MIEELNERQKKLKERWIEVRGFWTEKLDPILRWDIDFLEVYLNYSGHPWKKGALPPKIKEFIYIAVDASTTHLHASGTRTHIQNALKYGATKEEIMEVLECASVLGVHTMTLAVPILAEELKNAGTKGDKN